jgi:hypothetical protein
VEEDDEIFKEENIDEIKNINQDLDLEYPESVEDVEKSIMKRRKRHKLSTPKKSYKFARQEECVDKNSVDNKIDVDDQTHLEGRKNLRTLLKKICSIPNENALGSNFDILNGKSPSFYGLSPGKSKFGLCYFFFA